MVQQSNRQNRPRIWLLTGSNTGDDIQAKTVADELELPYTTKQLAYKPRYSARNDKPFFRPAIHHLTQTCLKTLCAPWPDLIITIGHKLTMAAMWIQKQSGYHSKIVLLSRPRQFQRRFALMIASAQYQGIDSDHIMKIDFPLMRHNQQAIDRAAIAWQERCSAMPRPITAVMVGGATTLFRCDAQVADELIDAVERVASDGLIYISTSPRTPQAVVNALKKRLQHHRAGRMRLFCWSADTADNPYLALLALADRFVVTGDSISMMVEVAQCGKPLAIFALPYHKNPIAVLKRQVVEHSQPLAKLFKPLIGMLQRIGVLGYTCDLTIIRQLLYKKGLAVPLGEAFLPADNAQLCSELPRVVARIKQLIAVGQ